MIMMAIALVLSLVAVALTLVLRDAPEQAVASETKTTTKTLVGSLIRGESPIEPWREKARTLPTPEVSKDESNPVPPGGEPKPEFASAPEAEDRSQSEPLTQSEPQVQAEPKTQAELGQRTLRAGESDWVRPTREEIKAANN